MIESSFPETCPLVKLIRSQINLIRLKEYHLLSLMEKFRSYDINLWVTCRYQYICNRQKSWITSVFEAEILLKHLLRSRMASNVSEEKLLFVCIPYRFENQYLFLLLMPVEWLIIGSNSGIKWELFSNWTTLLMYWGFWWSQLSTGIFRISWTEAFWK